MMRRRELLAGVTVLGLLTACAPGSSEPPPTYKYRLTATVETPQGERSGSSVVAVWWWSGSEAVFGKLASAGFKVRGEAVAVDLPDGQTLFVLLSRPGDSDWAAYVHESIPVVVGQDQSRAAYWAALNRDRAIHPVKQRRVTVAEDSDNYPYMVRFHDLADSKSVEQVAPDNLAATFGPGYRLKSLTVQVTDEPVTRGIEKRLGWLSDLQARNARLNGSSSAAISTNDLSDNLGAGNFSTEVGK
jgi:hypothetical protein